jgi:hypothetical protein
MGSTATTGNNVAFTPSGSPRQQPPKSIGVCYAAVYASRQKAGVQRQLWRRRDRRGTNFARSLPRSLRGKVENAELDAELVTFAPSFREPSRKQLTLRSTSVDFFSRTSTSEIKSFGPDRFRESNIPN